MSKYLTYSNNLPDYNMEDNFNEDVEACHSCGFTAELDSDGRCYDCGYEDANEYEKE